MSDTIQPTSADDVLDTLKWGLAEKATFDVTGAGSKQGFGHDVQADHKLDLSKLSGIDFYQPEELVLSAGPATSMDEITKLLNDRNQQLAFEPPNLSAHFGGTGGAGSLGGVLACDLAGPRRVKIGSARDHFLGFDAVSGRGEVFKSGGRVIKNVSGFDLSKLMAGSFGTLAVMTRVIVKTLPAPEKIRTVLIGGDTGDRAIQLGIERLMTAMNSPHDISGAAYVPENLGPRSSVDLVNGAGCGVAAIRIEGPPSSVHFRCQAIKDMFASAAFSEELHTANSKKFWQEIRDVDALKPEFNKPSDRAALWRLSVPPSMGAHVAAHILNQCPGNVVFDWGGGLLWLSVSADNNASNVIVRSVVGSVQGHATLISAPSAIKQLVPVFHPLPGPLATLSIKIRSAFDPEGLLNPGRMGSLNEAESP